MNFRMIGNILGKIMMVEATLLLMPLILALSYGEPVLSLWAFLLPMLALVACGLPLVLMKARNQTFYAKEGFLIVALAWVVMSVFGALPFLITGSIPHWIDALFETVSGFTTTGASVLSNIEALPQSLLFWRSFTHWIGGMGVLVFVLAVLPQSDAKSMHLMRAEMPGPKVGKLVAKVRASARILYGIYIFLSMIEIILLLCGGMPLFDSVVNTFSTAGTGGFAVKNASIAFYDSTYVDVVITVFMFLFGINFNLFFYLLVGNVLDVVRSEELRWYFGITVVSILLVTVNILHLYRDFWEALRYSSFQVVSIMTTTGFVTADFLQWPMLSQMLLVLLMFIGACAGSTGGGIKVMRIVLMGKMAGRETQRLRFPRAVKNVYFDRKPVESTVLTGIGMYFVSYMLIYLASMFLLAFDRLDFTSIFTSVAACINNVGPGLGSVGPVENYGHLSGLSKLVLSFDMLAGRLEIFPMLVLFSPMAWRRG